MREEKRKGRIKGDEVVKEINPILPNCSTLAFFSFYISLPHISISSGCFVSLLYVQFLEYLKLPLCNKILGDNTHESETCLARGGYVECSSVTSYLKRGKKRNMLEGVSGVSCSKNTLPIKCW